MKFDLSFWRFVIIISFAKSFLWGKGNDTYYLHLGTFTDGDNTALKLIILPMSIMIGLIKKENRL